MRNGSFASMVSERAWIGRGRRQSLGSGNPQRIGTTRRARVSASQMMTRNGPPTRKVTMASLLPSPSPCPSPPLLSVNGCEKLTTSLQEDMAVNLPHMAERYHRRQPSRYRPRLHGVDFSLAGYLYCLTEEIGFQSNSTRISTIIMSPPHPLGRRGLGSKL